jgi:hypothetical protein
MAEKPEQFSEAHASIFQDASVVAAYRHRPPYPPETFRALVGLIPLVDHIDAVDISEAMISILEYQCGARSLSPATPATISVMQASLSGAAGSPKSAIPSSTVPAVPIPVQIA